MINKYEVTNETNTFIVEASDFTVTQDGASFFGPRRAPTLQEPYPRTENVAFVGHPIRSIIVV